jgi:predicted TIM-barrel fold metal-dependent hydrolase
MIVDCHTHFWKAEHWSDELAREATIARGAPAQTNIDEQDHWRAMEPVDRAVVFGFRAAHLGLVVPNEIVARYVALHPEKLIGFACIDPNEANYLDEMRCCFEELRFRGLKLAPVYQNYHPCDSRMEPVYAYCETNHLPILFHQGTTFPRRAPLQYASPLQLEEVALTYPDLVIVIAHMGHPWTEDTTVLIRKQPNVYADISALYYRPWQFYNALLCAQEYGAAHKLLFGSDYPFTTPTDSIKGLKNVNRVIGQSGLPRISEENIHGILERDALNLLRVGGQAAETKGGLRC